MSAVVRTDEWPRRAETVARSTPSASRRLAWLCRRTWRDAPLRTHLHAQHGAIYTQHHHRRCVLGGGPFTATVAMVLAQSCAIASGRFPQSLDYLPNAHGADFDSQQQPG